MACHSTDIERPVGSNGLADSHDFLPPVAAYENDETSSQLVARFAGNLWTCELEYSRLDVVSWRGNSVRMPSRESPLSRLCLIRVLVVVKPRKPYINAPYIIAKGSETSTNSN
jgi:hypothetical protein